jgi:multiple sugar transport system permease protein
VTLASPERTANVKDVAAKTRKRSGSWRPRAGWLFVAPYTALLVLFGIIPVIYSLYLAFTNDAKHGGGFAGFSNFTRTAKDYRFMPALEHVAIYLVIWLVSLMILVVMLTLLVHQLTARRRTQTFLRLAYYLPGAFAGAASVLLWLFVLDPTVSPVAPVLKAMGFHHFTDTITPHHLPIIFAIVAFWTGAGGWILVLYGALNTIPGDVMEAARVDGAGPLRTALFIQLPMIRRSIAYMLILAFAAGTQLFVEPQLISQASFGIVPNDYSLNQLAYQYAFTQNDFNGSAAISLDLLVIALISTGLFVARGRLFDTD